MIFALSTCGAAKLRLHGPVGLRGFLIAIQSFVRRKYPLIACVEVSDHDDTQTNNPTPEQANFDYERWHEAEAQSDAHMRIFPVLLHPQRAVGEKTSAHSQCLLCARGDVVVDSSSAPHAGTRSQALVDGSGRERRRADESDEHSQFRVWLLRFYTAKVPDKVPYVDVILNRYRGRYDDLKVQLVAKYGSIDERDAAACSDSSSSSDSSSDEESGDDAEPSDDVDFEALPVDRTWLLRFYARYQPEKLLHVDKVLKQFSGREDALKQMLLQKYRAESSRGEDSSPLAKRRKLQSSGADQQAPADPSQDVGSVEMQELHTTYVQPQASNELPSSASTSSLCYIMKYVDMLSLSIMLYPAFELADQNSIAWSSLGFCTGFTQSCGFSTVARITTSTTSSLGFSCRRMAAAALTIQCWSCTFLRPTSFRIRGNKQQLLFVVLYLGIVSHGICISLEIVSS